MSVVVRTVTRWIVAFIFLYGLYTVAYGHLSPGGGFPGGVILSCAFVLMVLAWGKERALQHLPFRVAKGFDSAGGLLFLGVALAGLMGAGTFFINFIQKRWPGTPMRLFNSGIIPLCNVAIAMKVCASLFLLAVALSALRVLAGGDESTFKAQEEE